MDVVTAYLHREIDENIYVYPPKEFTNPNDQGQVWKLKKPSMD